MKKLILSALLILSFLLFLSTHLSFAADYNTSCTSSTCSPSTLSSFFPSSEIWYPGKTSLKSVQITNTSSGAQPIGVYATNTLTTGSLDQVIQLVITRSDSSTAWSGTLSSFYGAGEVNLLSSLSSGANETFTFTATMNTSAGNEYQNTMTKFDLVFGLIGPAPVGKTSSLSLSCTNTNFDAIMELKNDDIAQSGIKVKFTYKGETKEENTNASGKAIAGFSYSDESEVKAEPDGGYPSRTATIRLSDCTIVPTPTGTGTTAAAAVTPATLVLGAFSPFFGPAGEVAGETTITGTPTPEPTITGTGEVKGETTKSCGCFWWPILLGEIIILAIYFYLIVKDINKKRHIGIGLAGSAITYIIFLILNPCLQRVFFIFVKSTNLFCLLFWLLDLLVLTAIFVLRKKFYPFKENGEEIFDEKNEAANNQNGQ